MRTLRAVPGIARTVPRALRRAAAVLAIGSTLAQVLRMTTGIGLGHVAWNSPALRAGGAFEGGDAVFGFVPLLVSVALLATSAALGRERDAPRT